jgi:hypothetical protein
MQLFTQDLEAGKRRGRYRGGMPAVARAFLDDELDLALSSHFSVLYSDT